jgi:hypothetical protein
LEVFAVTAGGRLEAAYHATSGWEQFKEIASGVDACLDAEVEAPVVGSKPPSSPDKGGCSDAACADATGGDASICVEPSSCFPDVEVACAGQAQRGQACTPGNDDCSSAGLTCRACAGGSDFACQ